MQAVAAGRMAAGRMGASADGLAVTQSALYCMRRPLAAGRGRTEHGCAVCEEGADLIPFRTCSRAESGFRRGIRREFWRAGFPGNTLFLTTTGNSDARFSQ